MSEQSVINKLEERHMTQRRLNRYTALEEINFHWDWNEVKQVIDLWKSGTAFVEIAGKVGRDEIELAVLILDLRRENRINPRSQGLG